MKKRIFAMALIAALMVSLAMFASCTKEPEEEEIEEEEISIMVTVKIIADDGTVLLENEDISMTGLPSQLTAIDAMKQALSAADPEIPYQETDGMFDFIGDYTNIAYADMELEEGEERPEGEGMYWMPKINGNDKDVSGSTQINNGDVIEWVFMEIISWQ